jgi:transposase
MERSAIHILAKRGKSQRAIARDLGISRTTVGRALDEPIDRRPIGRPRGSIVDAHGPQIEHWLRDGLSIVRMLELVRADPDRPFTGGRSTFNDRVRRIRSELEQGNADVPIRFEGLPGEYLQVDWGEVRRFPFMQQAPATRYFLACRLKYSRWVWLQWTTDMRQEILLRGLVDCFCTLGWVPWVLIFDNMRTVTSGRDAGGRAIWHPALLQLSSEFGFHPQACAVGRGNQKGSVESLVKWVKGNFVPGRSFADHRDLVEQSTSWMQAANVRTSDATGVPPLERLPQEATKGGRLPVTSHDYGFLCPARVSPESLIHLNGNCYSVPTAQVGATVAVRLHRDRIAIFQDTTQVADHNRSPDGAGARVINPAHFQPLFGKKPRAQVMLYRQVLLDLGGVATQYVSELSCRRRDRLREEVLALHDLLERTGKDALLEAMQRAAGFGGYGVEYLEAVLAPGAAGSPLLDVLPDDVPTQEDVDRQLAHYEDFVTVSSGGSTW